MRIGGWTGDRSYSVIGVASDVRYNVPDFQPAPFHAYLASGQETDYSFGILTVRSAGDPLALTSNIRSAIASVDPDVPLAKIGTLSELITTKFGIRRLGILMVGFFSGATLLLSAIGLYAVLAYAVSQRTREIGIRKAVGAHSANILRLVIRRGLKLAGIGLVIGVIAALALCRVMTTLLYGVSPTDPFSLLIAIVVLSLTALTACLLPPCAPRGLTQSRRYGNKTEQLQENAATA